MNLNYNGKIAHKSWPGSSLGAFLFPSLSDIFSQSKYPYQYYLEQKQISCNTAHVNVITHDISLSKTKQSKNNTEFK